MNRFATIALVSSVALALAACGHRDVESTPRSSAAAPSGAPERAPSDAPVEAAAARPDTASVTPAVAKRAGNDTVHAADERARPAPAALSVRRLVVAKSIDEREPEGASTAFWQGDFDRLYAFVELSNPQKTESKIVVRFVSPSGKERKGNVTLSVGASPRWRTWAYSRAIDEKGTWSAVVTTVDGTELSRQTFEIL